MLSFISLISALQCGQGIGKCVDSGCSEFGWCGTSAAYTSGNCQRDYSADGLCKPKSCDTISETVLSSDGSCGYSKNNQFVGCSPGYCCSKYGYCGTGDDYCNDNIKNTQVSVLKINEGQALKCSVGGNGNFDSVYRFTNKQIRWYPNPSCASSWDPTWTSFITIDCSNIPLGPNMEQVLSQETCCDVSTPHRFVEGQSLQCSAGGNGKPGAVYRYLRNKIRWYPNPDIASSWDPTWQSFITVDCTNFRIGPDMPPGPKEGQALKCSAGGNGNPLSVYRFTKNRISWYPNPTIASSWDTNWGAYITIDCTGILMSPDMPLAPPEGSPVKCSFGGNGNSASVYRFTNNKVSWYPNPTIASSWDVNWTLFITIDCTNILIGLDMPLAPYEGQAINCINHRGSIGSTFPVFRFTMNKVCRYGLRQIAISWDLTFETTMIQLDCSNILIGPPMPVAPTEGQTVKCSAGGNGIIGALYRFTRHRISWYSSNVIAASWDDNWMKAITIDCSAIHTGPDMPKEPCEGQALKCSQGGNGNPASVYRYTDTQIRWYPNPTIATSWDDNWGSFATIDCRLITLGPNMPLFDPLTLSSTVNNVDVRYNGSSLAVLNAKSSNGNNFAIFFESLNAGLSTCRLDVNSDGPLNLNLIGTLNGTVTGQFTQLIKTLICHRQGANGQRQNVVNVTELYAPVEHCRTWGDPHILTFATKYQQYDHVGIGLFWMVRTVVWDIQVDQQISKNWPTMSINYGVAVRYMDSVWAANVTSPVLKCVSTNKCQNYPMNIVVNPDGCTGILPGNIKIVVVLVSAAYLNIDLYVPGDIVPTLGPSLCYPGYVMPAKISDRTFGANSTSYFSAPVNVQCPNLPNIPTGFKRCTLPASCNGVFPANCEN